MEIPEIRIFEFTHLKREPGIIHGIFTRAGGVSTGAFESLNVGMNSGDNRDAIARNRKLITLKMGMKPFVFLNQVHGDTIKVLKHDDNDMQEVFEPGVETYTADALVTDMKDIFLVIQVADCQAVMLYDPEKKVIANVHSGWKGSIVNIAGATIDKMVEIFGCRPEDIMAGISPSLGPCCAEFRDYKTLIPEHLWKYKSEDRDYFDFWKMTEDQLMHRGVKKDNIENMHICTVCNNDLFYSYRREKTTGRFACVIALTE